MTQLPEATSEYYFDSYSHFGIHEDMLKDQIRTLSYKKAIENNPSLVQGKVILDVGCGTGILSLFAAHAGAKKVYAIEKSSIVDYARQIIADNGYSNIITVLQGSMEEIELPEKVDLIISEWMGYSLLYESMLPSVISARDRFMKPTGTMFPSHARMFIAGIDDPEYYKKKITYWTNVYGFDFSPIKEWALLEPLVDVVPENVICTHDSILIDFDLNKCSIDDLSISTNFTLNPIKGGTIDGVVVWFSVYFRGGESEVELSTSPHEESTHWSQTIFYLKEKLPIDGNITGDFSMKPNERNPRDQDYTIKLTSGLKSVEGFYKMR